MKLIKILSITLLTFSLLAISITSILIMQNKKQTNNENELQNSQNTENINSGDNNFGEEEQGINLYDTYNQNDLLINKITDQYNDIEITIPQIEGLKNKEIQNKINTEMKNRIYEKLSTFPNVQSCDFYVRGNFANIISIGCNFSWNDWNNYDSLYLNYELVNGTKLNFEDIFKKDTDIISIVRKGFYREFARDAYYEAMNPVVESLDENEVYRKVREFMKQENKSFSISPTQLVINTDEYSYAYIKLIDIADEVVVYNKYFTEESIFERDDIGHKNIFTCASSYYDMFEYIEYGYAEDNFWFDITKINLYDDNMSGEYLEKFNNLKKEQKDNQYIVVEEYKKKARENPDKFYIYNNKQRITPYCKTDYENGELVYKYSYITTIENEGVVFEMPLEYYNNVYKDKIINAYRNANYAFNEGTEFESVSGDGITIRRFAEGYSKNGANYGRTINLDTKEDISKLEDVFVAGSGYKDVIKYNTIRNFVIYNMSIDNVDDLMKNANYIFTNYCIEVLFSELDFSVYIDYSEFDDSMMKLWAE